MQDKSSFTKYFEKVERNNYGAMISAVSMPGNQFEKNVLYKY